MSLTRLQFSKLVLFVMCLVPAGVLGWNFYHDQLGANPFEALTRESGDWTLRFLLLTLLMTPLRGILHLCNYGVCWVCTVFFMPVCIC